MGRIKVGTCGQCRSYDISGEVGWWSGGGGGGRQMEWEGVGVGGEERWGEQKWACVTSVTLLPLRGMGGGENGVETQNGVWW